MESLKRYWHCISFCLTGCPLRSLLSLRLKFSLFTLDATPQPQSSALWLCFLHDWSHSVYLKNGVSSVLNSDFHVQVSSPEWLGWQLFQLPTHPGESLTPLQPVPFCPPRATTPPRASGQSPCSHAWFLHFHKASCWLDMGNIVQIGVFLLSLLSPCSQSRSQSSQLSVSWKLTVELVTVCAPGPPSVLRVSPAAPDPGRPAFLLAHSVAAVGPPACSLLLSRRALLGPLLSHSCFWNALFRREVWCLPLISVYMCLLWRRSSPAAHLT